MVKPKKYGFTLLELLLAFLLLTILTASVAKFYSQGKVIYKKLTNKKDKSFQLKEFEYDLKRIVVYGDVNFTMKSDKIYFLKSENNRFYYTEYIKEYEYEKTVIRKRELQYPVDFETLEDREMIDILSTNENISWEVLTPAKKKIETIELGEEEESVEFSSCKKWTFKETPQILKIVKGVDECFFWIGTNKYNFNKDNYFIVKENEDEES